MAVPGTMGKILFVDLASGEVKVHTPPDSVYENYLGGYGLGAHVLFRYQKPGADPLGPDNILGFATGLLTGTPAISSGRYTVVGKSPKTGGWGDANSGGHFGPRFKRAGMDAVFFTGIAAEPVVLILENGRAALRPANGLWGLDSNETDEKLRAEFGQNAGIACIGPVGERAQLLACVMNDKGRAAGRSGLGAVMGAKRIKAIVAVGDQEITIADKARMDAIRKECMDFFKSPEGVLYNLFHDYGTPGVMANAVRTADAPIKNWAGVPADMPHPEAVSDDNVIKYQIRPFACSRCPLGCGGEMEVPTGEYETHEGHKPEYETLAAIGSMMLIDNVEAIIKINDLCNRGGTDTISTGTTMAFAMECFNRGILTLKDTGGLDLTWGNEKAVVKLTEQIMKNEGFGRVLADGIKKAVERIGPDAGVAAMHVGGEELPMHDPRLNPGLGMSYRGDATPGRHTQFSAWFHESGFTPVGMDQYYHVYKDKYNPHGKADAHRVISNWGHVVNASGLCMFGVCSMPAKAVPEFLSAALGRDVSMADVIAIGHRIATLRAAFNARERYSPVDVKLPARVLGKPPLEAGPLAGKTIDSDTELQEYFAAMGWDERGKPTRATLEKYGLHEVAAELYA